MEPVSPSKSNDHCIFQYRDSVLGLGSTNYYSWRTNKCHHNFEWSNDYLRHSVFSKIISNSVMDAIHTNNTSSDSKSMLPFPLGYNRSVIRIDVDQCFESFKWKIHTSWYITHWTNNTLLTKLEEILSSRIPLTTLACAWIWTSMESTKISSTSVASARIIDRFGRIHLHTKQHSSLFSVFDNKTRSILHHLSYSIMTRHAFHASGVIDSFSPLTTNNTPI